MEQQKSNVPAAGAAPQRGTSLPAGKRGGPGGGGRGGPGGGHGRGGPGGGRGGPGGGHGGRGGRREPSEYEEEVLQIDRVTRVVKGGRRLRFRATVVVGNRKGKVGIGIGKSHEVVGAIQKAITQAKKDMVVVPLKNGTIPHDVTVKFKSAKIFMMPASPGTGIIAGGAVRKIAELAGIKNMLSKMFGARNRITNAQAMMIALGQLKPMKKPTV
ncbi:MAG: 30S ribosomal protein S5 [Patescibacteria group bacterium]